MQRDTVKDGQFIRITGHGKIRTWVAFALDFLDENEDQPLILHTLPPTEEAPSAAAAEQSGNEVSKVRSRRSGSKTATDTIPRLITVAEIIKREHLERLRVKKSPLTYGVHQYNEIGCLEDLSPSPHLEPHDPIAGLKNVRIERTVYMKITLCRKKVATPR